MEHLKKAGKMLLSWYQQNKRDLPWRQTNDPYKIWISEIMLQQTRVDTAMDYYIRFITRFPDVEALAAADEDEVLSLWKGLGYYGRARNLHKAAKIIAGEYQGVYPMDYDVVKTLPGIGPYTSGAILSIAFNKPYAAVDGNVLRVVSRIAASTEDIAKDSTRKKISRLVLQMMPEGSAGSFNQGLMDLGATICLPQNPRCIHCPVQSLCMARKEGLQEEIPVKVKKGGPIPEVQYRLAVIEGKKGLLMEYRRNESLLSRLWGIPMVEKKEGILPEDSFKIKYRLKLKELDFAGTSSHVFSHRIWKMEIFRYLALSEIEGESDLQWFQRDELKQLAIPTAFQKVLDMLEKDRALVAEQGMEYEV